MGRWVGLFVLTALQISRTYAADLDVAAAQAKYNAQRSMADMAKGRYDSQLSILNQLKGQLSQAQSAENQAAYALNQANQELENIDNRLSSYEAQVSALQNQVDKDEYHLNDVQSQLDNAIRNRDRLQREYDQHVQQLRQVENRIQNLQNQPKSGPWTCVYVDHGFEEHSGGHRATDNNRSQAESNAKTACLAVHGSCDLYDCTQPDPPELAQLRRRAEQLQQEINQDQSDLSYAQNQVSSMQQDVNNTQYAIQTNNDRIRQLQNTISATQRERDRQARVVDNAEYELQRARNATYSAQQAVNQQQPYVDSAEDEWQAQERLASQAYAYWQQVQANYNAALADVYQRADRAASDAAYREAQERAPFPGGNDGTTNGIKLGTAKGLADAALRDKAAGYQEGRAKGSSDASLAQNYSHGTATGIAVADKKAFVEKFPVGYNNALSAHFAAPPTEVALVDISESVSQDPGGSGDFLSLTPQKVGSLADPSVVTPQSPTIAPPAYSAPGVNVPGSLKPYYSPPCSGLVLAEFGPLCLNRYESSYQSNFQAHYQTLYLQSYQKSYAAAVTDPYQKALAATDVIAFAAGRAQGADDQGMLVGFANHLEAANSQQLQAGALALKEALKAGAYVMVREMSLEEMSGDGVFTPGEKARLKIVVDNLGLQPTKLEGLRVRLTGHPGMGEPTFNVRGLPALGANTRTTLTGVVAAPITTQYIAEKLALAGVIEAEQAGKWSALAKLEAGAETHFPLELADVIFPKNPKLNETLTAKFRFTNRTKGAMEAAALKVGTAPQFVVVPKPDIQVDKLEAGAAVDVPVEVKPGIWVGENTFVSFFASTVGEAPVRQVLPKYLKVDRTVALNLFDSSGKPVPNSTLVVQAGAPVTFYVQLVFNAKQGLPGPFVVRASSTSTPTIPFAAGATTSVNYGALSPSTQIQKVRLSYNVPKEYKGKTGWVMVQADDGANVQHALMVYLDVR